MPQPIILIIEDDTDQLMVLASMLGNAPYPVEAALNGNRALEILSQQVPVLVITDLVMPDVSGSDIIQFIRADARFQETKIIIVTAFLKYVSQRDTELADRVLIKPIKQDTLEPVIRELLMDFV